MYANSPVVQFNFTNLYLGLPPLFAIEVRSITPSGWCTRSQAGRKHLGTTMLGREPTTPSSRAEVTGLNEPSQSYGLWCKTMSLDMAISFMNIAGQPHPHARARMLTTASR